MKKTSKIPNLILAIGIQVLLIILYLTKQSIWIRLHYTTQLYEKKLESLQQQKKDLILLLHQAKNPKVIKRYAENNLDMQQKSIKDIKRIIPHESTKS